VIQITAAELGISDIGNRVIAVLNGVAWEGKLKSIHAYNAGPRPEHRAINLQFTGNDQDAELSLNGVLPEYIIQIEREQEPAVADSKPLTVKLETPAPTIPKMQDKSPKVKDDDDDEIEPMNEED